VVEGGIDSGLEKRVGTALSLTGADHICGLVGESFDALKRMKLDFVAASYACGVATSMNSEKEHAYSYHPVFCGMKLEC